ncbi:MAG TPA: hypothetical protein VMD53_10650 [Rhizomicrobium sp.]|nr:hypothetical protein [Rhizomicrobium sp.]
MDRIDFQLLLDLRTALLGRHDAIADRRQRAIPEALPGILLHRPQRVLAVLFRLILVEQRHDLTHHHAHRIIPEILRDGDQPHAVLGKLADIEFELELVAEEAREGVNDDDGEGRRLDERGFNHRLKRGPAVIGRGIARLDILSRHVPALGLTIAGDLSALIGDRQIAFSLPPGRHAKIEGRLCGRAGRSQVTRFRNSVDHDSTIRLITSIGSTRCSESGSRTKPLPS